MTGGYEDILELAARAGATPLWWDQHGTPRFAPHHPKHCPDIYADEVVLLVIACQLCGYEMPVQMSQSAMDRVRASLMKVAPLLTLAERCRKRLIHYGDPPWHDERGEFCHAGCTMNCEDIRVLEFWHRENFEWARVAELEIEIRE
jgi:hypothetical protein